jgi:hypothetical protein
VVIRLYGTNIYNFKRGKDVIETYTPNADFKKYLDDRLHHETLYQRKIHAGEKISEELQNERNNLDRMKDYWLNKCAFPSMANLTVFLEYIANSEELRKVFDRGQKH